MAYNVLIVEDQSMPRQLFEIPVQPFMIDKTLKELRLPDKYNVIVAGIMKDNKYSRPIPDEKFRPEDRLLVTGTNEDIEKMMKEND